MKKIIIDLEKCYKCGHCETDCSYFYHRGKVVEIKNNGVEKLLAKASQFVVCRKCETKFCAAACPNKALEPRTDGILIRHLMLCTSCKNCSIACPFGTIYPEILDYKSSGCDFCVGRADENNPPVCVTSCKQKALEWREIDEAKDKTVYSINERLAVNALSFNERRK